MEISHTRFVPQPPARTWQALHDPDVLRACIPGCESVDRVSDTEMQVVMQAQVGPVSARFRGRMTLSELNPPHSYTVTFEGQGGAMGFGKGKARVRLAQAQDGTDLHYEVSAQVGGKLAQIGARLVDAAARKLADDFFARFVAAAAAPGHAGEPEDPSHRPTLASAGPRPGRTPARWIWAAAIALAAAACYVALL